MSRHVARVLAFLRSRQAMSGSLVSLAIKAGGAILMVLIFILAARTISPVDFGHLAVAFNALSFFSVFAVFGQDTLFVRSWGEYFGRDDALAHGAFWFGWRVIIIGAGLAFLGLLLVGVLGPWHFSPGEILAGGLFLIASMALQYSSNTCRHILNFVISETNRELTWRLVLLFTVLAALRFGLVPEVFFFAAAAGIALSVAVETVALVHGFPKSISEAPIRMHVAAWVTRAQSMWMSASVEAAAQYAEVMVLGLIVSPDVAGGYFVAARVANIFPMLTTGLHTYTVSHASNLYFSRETMRLQGIFRSVMSVALSMTTPILMLVILAGQQILGLFGPHYATHTGTLLLLAGASYVSTMSGPSSAILQITGHEKLYSRVILCALLTRLALVAWLAPRYGAFGAAMAWAAVNAPVAIGLSLVCRSLCGIDPSILSIFRHSRSDNRSAVIDPV